MIVSPHIQSSPDIVMLIVDYSIVQVIVTLCRPQVLESINTVNRSLLRFRSRKFVEYTNWLQRQNNVIIVIVIASVFE